MTRLFDWLESLPQTPISEFLPPPVASALDAQDQIGWELPFTGMWLKLGTNTTTLFYKYWEPKNREEMVGAADSQDIENRLGTMDTTEQVSTS